MHSRTSILASVVLACSSASAYAATAAHDSASGLRIQSPTGDVFTTASVPLNLRLGNDIEPESLDIRLNGREIDASRLTLGSGNRACTEEPRALPPTGRGKFAAANGRCDPETVHLQGTLTPDDGLLPGQNNLRVVSRDYRGGADAEYVDFSYKPAADGGLGGTGATLYMPKSLGFRVAAGRHVSVGIRHDRLAAARDAGSRYARAALLRRRVSRSRRSGLFFGCLPSGRSQPEASDH